MNKSTGSGKSAQAARYKVERKWESNRLKKLTRALKKNPENIQIEEAIKNIAYRRKTPKTPVWSHTSKADAQRAKRFKLPKGYFSKIMPVTGSSFSLGNRISA